ncbi:hypothetical protein FOA52_006739 [Chlamydomonas sp. UWO 241]|nr:hypothetical protein FOA52_006739 [Chlamydomonas sp. UWO 241]
MADNFDSLPHDVLELVVGLLSPVDLVMLSITSKELCGIVSTSRRWEVLSRQRWPLCCFDNPGVPSGRDYVSYQQLYVRRMGMAGFPAATDLLHTVTEAARHKSSSSSARPVAPAVSFKARQSTMTELLTSAVQQASRLHLCVLASPQLRRCPDYTVVMADVAWWLEEQPNALLAHARDACGDENEGAGFDELVGSLPMLRHMVAFCMPGTPLVHQSTMNRLARDICGQA